MLDLIIKNATIVDGTGKPAYKANVGVKQGKIVMNAYGKAKMALDAEGYKLCPGFIDAHSHADQILGCEDAIVSLCKVSQGITTEITGQCGLSPFPVSYEQVPAIRGLLDSFTTKEQLELLPHHSSFKEYLAYAQSVPKIGNYAFNCGHATLRAAVMGMANRTPTPQELEQMKQSLRDAMENGCLGLSSGLIYAPSVYAQTEELIELCKIIKPYYGIYATHMRSEANGVIDAVKEAIYIAEQAEVPLVISHHKICGKSNWGASRVTLQLVHEAIERGMSITLDQYPYEATQTYFHSSIPPRCFENGMESFIELLKDPVQRQQIKKEMLESPPKYNSLYFNSGGFDGMLIVSSPNVPEAEGLTVAEYAEKCKKNAFNVYFDLLISNRGAGLGAYFCLDKDELDAIYMDENTVVGTDGIINSIKGPVHPRAFGSFAKTLTYFCKEKKLLSFEQAIRKQTSLTAERWGLIQKGRIAEGYDADMVLLDSDRLQDMATYHNARQLCKGIIAVFVNGELVYHKEKLTQAHPGEIILRRIEKTVVMRCARKN